MDDGCVRLPEGVVTGTGALRAMEAAGWAWDNEGRCWVLRRKPAEGTLQWAVEQRAVCNHRSGMAMRTGPSGTRHLVTVVDGGLHRLPLPPEFATGWTLEKPRETFDAREAARRFLGGTAVEMTSEEGYFLRDPARVTRAHVPPVPPGEWVEVES